MNDSHARVSKDRKDSADERDEDTGEEKDASPSPSPRPMSAAGAGADSSIVPLNCNGSDSVALVASGEESPPTFAETSVRNRRASGLSLTMPEKLLGVDMPGI